jgi:nucleotide-binding universal stress UspA family protein
MKLDRVLVAVDFSDSSLAALDWAARHLAPEAEFVLSHTETGSTPPSFLRDVLPPHDATLDAIGRDASARLRQLAAALPIARVKAELTSGRPAEQIAQTASRTGADLILLGPHGSPQDVYDPVGGTAEELIRCCEIPVLVARAHPNSEVRRILASVDESSMTRPVLDWAAFLSSRTSADVVLVHVVDLGLYGTARTAASPDELQSLQQRAERAARAWLAEQAEKAGLDASRVHYHIAFGNPRFEIVTAGRDQGADLLIMGSRGAAEVGPAHLGGVASSVLRGSAASVLVVTDPAGGSVVGSA